MEVKWDYHTFTGKDGSSSSKKRPPPCWFLSQDGDSQMEWQIEFFKHEWLLCVTLSEVPAQIQVFTIKSHVNGNHFC